MAVSKELLPMEAIFIEEYLRDFNGARAARAAGYAEANSNQAAVRLMARPRVKKALAARISAYTGGVKPDIESVLKGYCAVANNPKVSNADRLHALDSLSKYLGMFIERRHTVTDERRVTLDLSRADVREAALALVDQLREERVQALSGFSGAVGIIGQASEETEEADTALEDLT